MQKLIALTGLLFATAACVTPASRINENDVLAFEEEVLRPMAERQPSIEAPMTLDDAIARALAFNTRQAAERQIWAERISRAGKAGKDLLPNLIVSGRYSARSNQDASIGVRVDDMSTRPEDFFTAVDTNRLNAGLAATWDFLDFGVNALQRNVASYEALRAEEQIHISCAALTTDVVRAWWRAEAFETAEEKSEWLRSRVDRGLELAEQAMKDDPSSAQAQLAFQRELIDIYRWYQFIYRTIAPAKAELAELVNLPAGVEFQIDTSLEHQRLYGLPDDDLELVKLAFRTRPEIRQSAYLERIIETRATQDLVRLLPRLTMFVRADQDSNSFLLNNSYGSAGLELTWNMLSLTQYGDVRRAAEATVEAEKLRTETLATAIVAQVATSRIAFETMETEMYLAWRAVDIQGNLTLGMAGLVDRGEQPEIYLIKEELMRELSILREGVARADHQAARARLVQSLGITPDCIQIAPGDLDTSRKMVADWQATEFFTSANETTMEEVL